MNSTVTSVNEANDLQKFSRAGITNCEGWNSIYGFWRFSLKITRVLIMQNSVTKTFRIRMQIELENKVGGVELFRGLTVYFLKS